MRTIDADALKDRVLKWMPSDPCGIEEKEFSFEADIVASLMMEIEEAPTIEPEPHWIPISERLPEKDGYYLVSKDDKRFFNALKPNKEIDRSWGISREVPICPHCEAIISPMYFFKNCEDKVGWCEYCGQKIDWSGWGDE